MAQAWPAVALALLCALAGCAKTPVIQEDVQEGPSVSFAWRPDPPVAGARVAFEPVFRIPTSTQPASWTWHFGDGGTSQQGAPWHTYESPGDFDVEVVLTTTDGTVLRGTRTVEVAEPRDVGPRPPPVGPEDNDTSEPGPSGPADMPRDAAPQIVALRQAIRDAIAADRSVGVPAYLVHTVSGGGYIGTGAWAAEQATDLPLRLHRSTILSSDTFWEIDGRPAAAPFVEVYEGHVEGDPDALARLTLSAYWARGSIRDGDTEHLVRIGFHGNMPERSVQADAPFVVAEPQVYDDEPGDCPGDIGAWVPLHAAAVVEPGRSTLPAIEARIILDGDAIYADSLGDDAFPMLVAMFAEVESIFDHEVSIRHKVVGVHLHETQRFKAPDTQTPLGPLAEYWAGRHTERDLVHLVTGHDSSFAQANCIGAAGHPDGAFTFTPLPWEERYVVFQTHAWAHELGHIYSAHHHYGNHAESRLATLMLQGYTPGELPVFSTLSKSVIRGWAEGNVQ